MGKPKFLDFVPPTKIAYSDGRPTELHLRKCKFMVPRGNKKLEEYFNQSIITLGAMEDNDLVVNDETVSRYHCKVLQEPDGYLLVDLDSTNGTFINGMRIREAYLDSGCTVTLGKKEIFFHFADEKVSIVPSHKESLGSLLGRNIKMREIYGIIEKIAPTGTTVVIEGETGTGKEVVAQTIHELSPRSKGSMMVFDCGAVPDNLIESELFGHEKGSFTGAIMTRQGIFEMAHGGTLLLDELGELSLDLQPKLLRALEHREIRRVGSNKPIRVDARVIAATNRNLEEEVHAGRFRQDLYYRLSVVRIVLPPLRERTDDIPLLSEHFLKTHSFNLSQPAGRPRVEGVSQAALEQMSRYNWPGNVRELLNVIERAVSFADGPLIESHDLPEQLHHPSASVEPMAEAPAHDAPFKEAKERWVSSFEREYILKLLQRNNGNISHAAREADIDRKYFRKLMRKYSINTDMFHD